VLEVVGESPIVPFGADLADGYSGVPAEGLSCDGSSNVFGELWLLKRKWCLRQSIGEGFVFAFIRFGSKKEDIGEDLMREVGDVGHVGLLVASGSDSDDLAASLRQ
jgi:hypothetical protein